MALTLGVPDVPNRSRWFLLMERSKLDSQTMQAVADPERGDARENENLRPRWLQNSESLDTGVLSDYNTQLTQTLDPLIRPCGLDALHFAVRQCELFTPEFERARREITKPYQRRQDYRTVGLPLIVIQPGNGTASRIFQFTGVGQMDARAILGVLNQTLQCDFLSLRVNRIDLTADWFSTVTINDCRKSIKVALKQNLVQYANPNRAPETLLESQRHECWRYETLYFGSSKSNDYLRVYDREQQLRKTKCISLEVPLPSPWIRFERVLTRDHIPPTLRTLGALFENGANYEPFANIQINPGCSGSDELIYKWQGPLNQRMNAAWTQYMIDTHGWSEAERQIRKENRKPKQMFELLDKIVADSCVSMPTPFDLTACYQTSFERQLFGHLEEEPPESVSPSIIIGTLVGNSPQPNRTTEPMRNGRIPYSNR